MKSSTYYFHMKTKILTDFQICISVPLRNLSITLKNLHFSQSRIAKSKKKRKLHKSIQSNIIFPKLRLPWKLNICNSEAYLGPSQTFKISALDVCLGFEYFAVCLLIIINPYLQLFADFWKTVILRIMESYQKMKDFQHNAWSNSWLFRNFISSPLITFNR